MIGRLEKTVFDCPDPRTLATFYAAVLGMQMTEPLLRAVYEEVATARGG